VCAQLEVGNVITVEPGCYFNPSLLLPAFENPAASKYLVKEAIMPYMSFGGVRIEDNVIVEESGARSLTRVPRTVEEIEAVMAGAPWPSA
jgi:Xaa-Pro dipeptidase